MTSVRATTPHNYKLLDVSQEAVPWEARECPLLRYLKRRLAGSEVSTLLVGELATWSLLRCFNLPFTPIEGFLHRGCTGADVIFESFVERPSNGRQEKLLTLQPSKFIHQDQPILDALSRLRHPWHE